MSEPSGGRSKAMAPRITRSSTVLARKCDCDKKPDDREGKSMRVQRKAAGGASGTLLSKLPVSVPDDPLEKEADRIADAIARGSKPTSEPRRGAPAVQREAAGARAPSSDAEEMVRQTISGDGEPLSEDLRRFMESGFGARYDFRNVRIHRDASAARSAEAVDARAYTVSNHVVFSAGSYQPASSEGRHLIAHELVHVVQQTGGTPAPAVAAAQASTPIARARSGKGAKPKSERKKWTIKLDGAYMKTTHEVETDYEAYEREKGRGTLTLLSFDVDTFYLPKSKGPVLSIYQDKVAAEGLSANVDLRDATKAGLWQQRADSGPLRTRWLRRMGWAGGKAADSLWQEAGGDASFPNVKDEACEMDHIVELQLGGTNVRDNIQALDKKANANAGGAILNQLFGLAKGIVKLDEFTDTKIDQVQLNFGSVKARATEGFEEPLGVSKKCKPAAADLCCVAVEACAEKLKPEGKEAAPEATDREPFVLLAGGTPATLQVAKGFAAASEKKKPAEVAIEGDRFNAHACELIPGMILETLATAKGKETVDARIESRKDMKDGRDTRLPITIEHRRGEEVKLKVEKNSGKLELAKSDADIKFSYPYLSAGRITKLGYVPGAGLTGEGVIEPSLPLLKRVPLRIKFGPEELKVVSEIPKDKLAMPPGITITEAQLALQLYPDFEPAGTLGFKIGPSKKPFVQGSVTVSRDVGGLYASADDLKATIPGVDEAKGTVTYRATGGWSGEFHFTSSRLPGVKKADVTARLGNDGFGVEGGLDFELPGGQAIELRVSRDKERVVYAGAGEFKVPGLEPVEVNFKYDGEHVTGSGRAAVKMPAFKGDVDVRYDDGKLTGSGALQLGKGKATGSLNVKMNERQQFSGEGSLTYQITQNLIATAGIVLHEDQRVTVKGVLEFPKPIKLFDGFNADKEIFRASVDIPIPLASLGPLGVMLRITGALAARFGVGPGELHNVRLAATFNPLDDNPDIQGNMTASLVIPAHAGVSGSVEAALALSAAFASVSGGIMVTAAAELKGEARAELKMFYARGKYELDAIGRISAGLILSMDLDSVVRAEAGVGPFKVGTSWLWKLAAFRYDTGLAAGIVAPFRYVSGEPFKPPALADIKPDPDPLQLDLKKLMTNILKDPVQKEDAAEP